MNYGFTRRNFVKTAATTVVGLGGLGALAEFSPATAEETKLQPDDVRLTPDIEHLVRLIEETPRSKIVAAMIEQLRKGVTYRQFLGAMFVASARMDVSPQGSIVPLRARFRRSSR